MQKCKVKAGQEQGQKCSKYTDLSFSFLSSRLLVVSLIVQMGAEAESEEAEGYTLGFSPLGDRAGQENVRRAGRSQMENHLQRCQIRFSFEKVVVFLKSIKSLEIISRSYFNSDSL